MVFDTCDKLSIEPGRKSEDFVNAVARNFSVNCAGSAEMDGG